MNIVAVFFMTVLLAGPQGVTHVQQITAVAENQWPTRDACEAERPQTSRSVVDVITRRVADANSMLTLEVIHSTSECRHESEVPELHRLLPGTPS